MEGIFELQHYIVPILNPRHPSHVLVIIISHTVILLLDHKHKKIPSGLGQKYSILLCGILLPVSFPPMFDIGGRLKE
jgi:hypothetical protein